MPEFNKKKVLETILKDTPILTNLRKEITLNKKKVVIYAYYFNRGEPDSELKYDLLKNPVKTTSKSTLCEIYSCWRNKPGKYSGPWLDESSYGLDPPFDVRNGAGYKFFDSPAFFAEHFNKICEKLNYEPRLNYDHVEIKRKAELNINGRSIKGNIIIDEPIGIILEKIDPSLSEILNLIKNAYKKAKIKSLPKSFVFLRDES